MISRTDGAQEVVYRSQPVSIRRHSQPGLVAVSQEIPVAMLQLRPGLYTVAVNVRDHLTGQAVRGQLQWELLSATPE